MGLCTRDGGLRKYTGKKGFVWDEPVGCDHLVASSHDSQDGSDEQRQAAVCGLSEPTGPWWFYRAVRWVSLCCGFHFARSE